jgi:preprotein translocase subunit SecG
MVHVLLALHFVLTIAIIGVILLQKHDSDGALGSSGGGAASGMFSVRGQANLLTRTTAVLMSLFIINCLIMAKKLQRTATTKESIIDKVAKEDEFHHPAEQQVNKPSTTEQSGKSTAKNTPASNSTTGNGTAGNSADGKAGAVGAKAVTTTSPTTRSTAQQNAKNAEAPRKIGDGANPTSAHPPQNAAAKHAGHSTQEQ